MADITRTLATYRLKRLVSVTTFVTLLSAVIISCESEQYEISGSQLPPANLPVMTVNTPDAAEIARSYVNHTQFNYSGTNGEGGITGEMAIKGHGNSTWILPKKPYSILLQQQDRLPGLDMGQQWILLANYRDMTLMRNDVALFMSREMSLLDFTPQSCFADLTLNGFYRGIYQICGSPEGCINNDDFVVIEIDGKARYHDITFHTTHNYHPFNIHFPEVTEGDQDWTEISRWVQQAEDVLYADYFNDSERGYSKYLDVMSFVEWYVINEIAKNYDAAFYTSCFMHYRKGGKITMGPVWDFDLAFGNYPYKNNRKVANNPEGFFIKNIPWYDRLFLDPTFVEMVKQRFSYYYDHRQDIYDHIDQNCSLLAARIGLENKLWGCLCSKSASEDKVRAEHQKKAEQLKVWIETRMQWLKPNIDAL